MELRLAFSLRAAIDARGRCLRYCGTRDGQPLVASRDRSVAPRPPPGIVGEREKADVRESARAREREEEEEEEILFTINR